jgi:hypothetical protein
MTLACLFQLCVRAAAWDENDCWRVINELFDELSMNSMSRSAALRQYSSPWPNTRNFYSMGSKKRGGLQTSSEFPGG